MTRARNIAGFSTITTTPSPVHVGPIGVLTATRIDGAFGVVDINPRHVNISGITTGLNVSGIITAQNGINFNGTSTGLNVSGIGTIATLNVSGNATIAGVLTYEDVTRVDSVGVVTARGLSIFGNTTGLQVASGISTFQAVTATTGTFSSNVTVGNNLNVAQNIIHTGDTDTKIEFLTDTICLDTAGSERLRVTSAGKIGIGTVSPDTPFHIYTNDPQQITVERSTNQNSNIRFRNTFGSMFAGLTSNATGFAIDDDDDLGASPMFIVTRESGDVGINRTPTQNDMPGVTPRLHVLGISTVGQFNTVARFESGTTDGNDTGAAVVINQTNDRGLVIQGGRGGDADGVHHANSGLGRFSIINNGGTFHKFMEAWGQNGQYIENISLFTGNEVERLRITSDGSIGIGSAIPRANFKLDVNGDLSLGESGGTDNTFIEQKQNGDLYLINSGRAGNGAAVSPTGGAGGVGINRYNTITGDTTYFRDFTVYNGKSTKVLMVDGSTSRVGIGTDDPLGSLDVRDATGSDPTMFIGHSNADVTGEFLRIGRVDLPGIRYHSIKAKHSGNSAANILSFNLHYNSTTTSQREILRLTGDGTVGIQTDTTNATPLVAYDPTTNTIANFKSGDAGAGIVLTDPTCQARLEQTNAQFKIDVDTGGTQSGRNLSIQLNATEKVRVTTDEVRFLNNIAIGPSSGVSNDKILRQTVFSDSNAINDSVTFKVQLQFPDANQGPFIIEIFQAHYHYRGTPSYCRILGAYGGVNNANGGVSHIVTETKGNIGTVTVTDTSNTTQRTNEDDYQFIIQGSSASSTTGTSLKVHTYVIVHSHASPTNCTFIEV